jgi:5-methylcytosine-specific restriction endonuclease McrA
MCWDNYGEWHIDHIIPISHGKNQKEIYKLNYYTNLRPLWKIENLKKSNKLIQQ